jgi:hypothetical protein
MRTNEVARYRIDVRRRRSLRTGLIVTPAGILGFLAITALSAAAQDATWLANPASNDLANGANWSTGVVPTGTAFFGVSSTTSLATDNFGQTFGGWTFNTGASAYTVTLSPNGFNQINQFIGTGISVDGGSVSIIIPDQFHVLRFANSSTAGGAAMANSGAVSFINNSSAGSSVIANNLDVTFENSSTAGNAAITNATGSGIHFRGSSTAASSSIINNSSEQLLPCFCSPTSPGLEFTDHSTAGNATITNAGMTQFYDHSSGGLARVINTGLLDFRTLWDRTETAKSL